MVSLYSTDVNAAVRKIEYICIDLPDNVNGKKVENAMKKYLIMGVVLLMVLVPFICSKACESPSIPKLILTPNEKLGISFHIEPARYSMTYWSENHSNPRVVCDMGIAPVSKQVFEDYFHLILPDDTTFTLSLDTEPPIPDSIVAFSWDNVAFADLEHAGEYQNYPDGVVNLSSNTIILKPNRIYSIEFKWQESENDKRVTGTIDYFIVTGF